MKLGLIVYTTIVLAVVEIVSFFTGLYFIFNPQGHVGQKLTGWLFLAIVGAVGWSVSEFARLIDAMRLKRVK